MCVGNMQKIVMGVRKYRSIALAYHLPYLPFTYERNSLCEFFFFCKAHMSALAS